MPCKLVPAPHKRIAVALLLALLHSVDSGPLPYKLCKEAFFDEKGAKNFKAFESDCHVLRRSCLEQETIIVFDSEAASQGTGDEGLPKIDTHWLEPMQYQFRRARTEQIAKAAASAGHNQSLAGFKDILKSVVKSVSVPYVLKVRYPAPEELVMPREYSKCTIPLIHYMHWPHSSAEFYYRSPAFILRMLQQHRIVDKDSLAYVIGTAAKTPLSKFNYEFLRPLLKLEPSSFAQFSSMWGENQPSNSTAEGVHMRCFEHVWVCRSKEGSYPFGYMAGQAIAASLKPTLPDPGLFTSASDDTVLKVLLELRDNKDARQFLHHDALLASCNSHAAQSVIKAVGVGLSGIECRAVVFGLQGFAYDVAAMQQANILVAFHGGGCLNMMFSRRQPTSALIEVRGQEFGTKHKWWPNMWWPLASHQSSFSFFWYAINVEDPALNQPSLLEAAGVLEPHSAEAARDRFVQLKWEHLWPVIETHVRLKGDRHAFEKMFHGSKVNFRVSNGSQFAVDPDHMWKQKKPNLR